MSKKAFNRIAGGLREAIDAARGEIPVEVVRTSDGVTVLRPVAKDRECPSS